ncbi:MAG: hypothetical protein ACJ75H_21760 [Thermoanaerobaculia bacterium]
MLELVERNPASEPHPARAAVLLFLLCLACYLANGRTVPFVMGGDTIPTRLIPFSLLAHGRLTLEPFRDEAAARGGFRWYVQEAKGRLVSFYPIGSSLVALPVYVPLYLFLKAKGRGDDSALFDASEKAEKIAASTIAAAAVAVFYLLLRRRTLPATAFWGAAAFGLASAQWATASQMLWQHGPVVLMLTTALWLLTWPERPAWSAAGAGFALAMAVLCRPTAAVFWLAGLAYVLSAGGSPRARLGRAFPFLAAGLPIAAFNLLYNLSFYDSVLGGYSDVAQNHLTLSGMLQGTAGLLVSPNRGLLIYTPAALLGIFGLARAFRKPRCPLLIVFGLAAVAHLLLAGSFRLWHGGWSFGPRYLVDILPILGLAGTEMWPRLGRAGKGLAWAALLGSVLVQLNGAVCYPASRWNLRMGDQLEQGAWDWENFSLWQDFQAWWELGDSAPRF